MTDRLYEFHFNRGRATEYGTDSTDAFTRLRARLGPDVGKLQVLRSIRDVTPRRQRTRLRLLAATKQRAQQ